MSLDRYYTLGRSGLRVSRLALGTMTFGTDWGWGAERDVAQRMFDLYVDRGGNFFDTADLYTNGTSERWLGEMIRASQMRDRAVIATKFSYSAEAGNPNAGGNGRKNILRAVDGSLTRLGTDYIDLYFLHTWDLLTPIDEVMRTLDDLVASGKVRYIGLSDVPAWVASRAQTMAELRGWERLIALQLEYSLVTRDIEHEFVGLGTQLGMGVIAWSPLASGLLSGKYRPGEAGEGRLAQLKDSGNPAFEKFTERNWAIVAELERVAEDVDRSMAQVAMQWVARRPGVASVLIGASKLHQLEDNLAALDQELPAELLERLDAASVQDPPFPYTFFTLGMQAMLTGGATVGDEPADYRRPLLLDAEPAGVE